MVVMVCVTLLVTLPHGSRSAVSATGEWANALGREFYWSDQVVLARCLNWLRLLPALIPVEQRLPRHSDFPSSCLVTAQAADLIGCQWHKLKTF